MANLYDVHHLQLVCNDLTLGRITVAEFRKELQLFILNGPDDMLLFIAKHLQ